MRKLRLTIEMLTDLEPAEVKALVEQIGHPAITLTHVAVEEITTTAAADEETGTDGVEWALSQVVADGKEGVDYTVATLPNGTKLVDLGDGMTIEVPKGDPLMRYLTKQPSSGNAIRVIYPYWRRGMWMFDDDAPGVGLKEEPFIWGASEALSKLSADIRDAQAGFALLFSEHSFPGSSRLDWVREEDFGNWFRWSEANHDLWLCPALLKYFDAAPMTLYVKAEPATEGERALGR